MTCGAAWRAVIRAPDSAARSHRVWARKTKQGKRKAKKTEVPTNGFTLLACRGGRLKGEPERWGAGSSTTELAAEGRRIIRFEKDRESFRRDAKRVQLFGKWETGESPRVRTGRTKESPNNRLEATPQKAPELGRTPERRASAVTLVLGMIDFPN